jgi:EAL domain-containing protein (putative c-di-GMP-specific phosphodiesterase class I)
MRLVRNHTRARGRPPDDPTNVRFILRRYLARATQATVLVALAGATLLRLGNQPLFASLTAFAAASLIVDVLAPRWRSRAALRIGAILTFAAWPVAFVVLGLAGWAHPGYHGEAVALIGMLVAGTVALLQGSRTTAAWTVAATLATLLGSGLGGPLGAEQILVAAGIPLGAFFGNRVAHGMEEVLGRRRRLLQEVARVPRSTDPYSLADALLQPLARHTPLTTISLIWFTGDGRSVMLGIIGPNLSPYLRQGVTLPAHRDSYFREQAARGPWITGWAVNPDDGGYSQSVAAMDVDAVIYVPLVHEGRTIGMIGGAVGRGGGGQSAVTEQVPILAEIAEVIAASLGPSLGALEERSSTTQMIEEILGRGLYWPVFQPIMDLASSQVVGYEALTRFDASLPTQRVFEHAARIGRGMDLETATMRAAVKAAASLPAQPWVSLNTSATLLADYATLREILEPLQRPAVLELSEHDMIADYTPISGALRGLGPGRVLAVDDAGAGFASLRHILEVRPAYVKMDIGLVQGTAHDATRRALVAGFVHFAHDANFKLIAEGIERADDLAALERLGVAMGQGNLLGRPDRAAAAAAALDRASVRQAARGRARPIGVA